MDGLGEIEKILGGGAGIAGLLVVGTKWLINSYFQKQKENEELKHKNAIIQENRLEDNIKAFRSAIDSINVQIKELSANLTMTRQEATNLKDRIIVTEKLLEQYTNAVDTKVANMIKSEVTNLTKQLMLIKTKRQP